MKNVSICYVEEQRPRSGPAATRNLYLKNASYGIVAFLDDDDYWLPSKLRVQVDVMKRMSFDIVLSSMIEYDEKKGRVLGITPKSLYIEKNIMM